MAYPQRPHGAAQMLGQGFGRTSLALAWVGGVALLGCSDNRVSIEELQQQQQALAAETRVEKVEPPKFNLVDKQKYRIQNGDVLNLTILGLQEANRYQPDTVRARVTPTGDIVIPLVGPVRVAGQDLAEAEQSINKAHSQIMKEPLAVHLEMVSPDLTTVVVHGAAEVSGLLTLQQNQRGLLYALSLAGAFGPNASGVVRLKPIDPKAPEVRFDLKEIDDVRRALTLAPLNTGDLITVEASDANVIYVSGLVNAPAAIPIPRNGELSMMRAIAAAGGFREYLDIKEATLVRKMPDGTQVQAKVDVEKVYKGEMSDVALVAGDILHVPHTLDTRLQDWVNTNVLRQFSIGVRYDPLQQYNTQRIIDQNNNQGGLRDSVLLNLSNLLLPTANPPVANP
ncbi:MAG: polysaccharide biosynthesis/export family protein [Phycisphaerae bacterium]|nr:polysaccharide biosynthesis/export family protein [Phycisphaerae bacterium]